MFPLKLCREDLPPQSEAACLRQHKVTRRNKIQVEAAGGIRCVGATAYDRATNHVPKYLVYVAAAEACESKRLHGKRCKVRIVHLRRVKSREFRGIVTLIDADNTRARLGMVKLPAHLKKEFLAALAVHANAIAARRMRSHRIGCDGPLGLAGKVRHMVLCAPRSGPLYKGLRGASFRRSTRLWSSYE